MAPPPIRASVPTRSPLLASAALATLLAGCGAPPDPDAGGPLPAPALEAWELRRGGELVGRMLLIEIQHPRRPVRRYDVYNADGQSLGFLDPDIGIESPARPCRVWQRVPFAMREADRGVHTMDKGLALLLERDGPFDLRAIEVDGRGGVR